jgi:hypothetical protein
LSSSYGQADRKHILTFEISVAEGEPSTEGRDAVNVIADMLRDKLSEGCAKLESQGYKKVGYDTIYD